MYVLRIQYTVADYAAWKTVFDGDPLGRARSHALRYRILRPADDASQVMVDLDFESKKDAEAFHAALRELWAREPDLRNAQARIVEAVEANDL